MVRKERQYIVSEWERPKSARLRKFFISGGKAEEG